MTQIRKPGATTMAMAVLLALSLGSASTAARAEQIPARAATGTATGYPELLSSVCSDLRHIMPAMQPSLHGKELLLQEAERLSLPEEISALLTERLSNNAFSISESQLWAPFESFDVALQARSEDAGLLKARFSRQRYSEYGSAMDRLSAVQQDAVRRAALTILAETGHLPEVIVPEQGRVRFVYREACLVDDAPGLMTTFIQGREREFDPVTGKLGPALPLRPEKATLSDPALAFSSDGTEVVRLRADQLEELFALESTQRLMREIHDEMLEIVSEPERLKSRLIQLIELFESAYGIEPVNLSFDIAPANDGGSGYYHHSARAYTFHYRRFIQKLGRFIARENIDLDDPRQQDQARRHMLGELVNNAAHELTHAGQYQWIERWNRQPGDLPASLHARVADYQKNHRYKNTAWESHTLIGIMGDADYDRYRHQPLEEDAWAIGGHAEALALASLAATETAPDADAPLEATRRADMPVAYHLPSP